jgi:DNA-binding XRE family transcriptional regulator
MDVHSTDKNRFPRLIREIRTRRKLTQRAFGELLSPKVTQQSVTQWEHNKYVPERKYWPQLAELASMDLGEFYEYIENGLASKPSSLLTNILQTIKTLDPKDLEVITQATAERWATFGEVGYTANKQHLALLKKGADVWNRWRDENRGIQPVLRSIDFNLEGCLDLSNYNLEKADLQGVTGNSIKFCRAKLSWADLSGAVLRSADFENAIMIGTKLLNASLTSAHFHSAHLQGADLSQANLEKATLISTHLIQANLSGANLTQADLRYSLMCETNLEKAILNNCSVYGAAVWRVRLEQAQQSELDTSPRTPTQIEAGIFCDSLELAQILDSISTNPPLKKKLQQRLQDEQQAIEYALCLVENYGEDQSNGSRIYTAPEESYRILSSLGDLEVIAPDSRSYLIRRDRNNLISSNLRPGDVDNLKALLEFETKAVASCQPEINKRKSTPRTGRKE